MLLRCARILVRWRGTASDGAGAMAAEAPKEMKLYVFSSGRTQSRQVDHPERLQRQDPDSRRLLRDPASEGNVLFDTGNNDKIITDPELLGPVHPGAQPGAPPDVAIDAQLRKINLTPDDIKYVAVGHMHLDHGGNVCKFPNATLLVQKDEMRNAWPEPGTAGPYIPGDVACLRNDLGPGASQQVQDDQLDGDMDVFGDHSVVIKRWPGHTPGSQMVVVRLPKTGTVVLTSDNVYFAENVTKNLLPSIGSVYDPVGMLDAYAWVKRVHDAEGGDIIYAHDPDVYKAHKHSPEYYE